MSTPDPIIDLADVSFRRSGREILRDVNWCVRDGEQWAIVGANGSGKTTLLRLATGYIWPSSGQIRALGETFGQVDLRTLRRRIGWVSSAIAEMIRRNQTALEIVLTGAYASTALFDAPTDEQISRAHELLEQFHCHGVANSRFGVLSLGEQQKVLIARALMPGPELLILDEACAGLDLPTREGLLGRIEALAAQTNMTLIFVTHHIEEIPPAFSHVLILRDGQVAAQGPKADILTGETLTDAMGIRVSVHVENQRYWPRVNGV